MGIQAEHWAINYIRIIFAFLDKIIYGLVKWVLFGVFDLSKITTNSDIFSGIYERIYVILGIFMAFKLSFSFFQYIVNPDKMNSKNDTGVAKIFTRVALMIGALMLLPGLLFGSGNNKGILARAQDAFLPVIPKFIFGAENNLGINFVGDVSQTVEKTSEEIAVTTLAGFFSPSEELDEYCGAGTYDKTPPIESLDDFSSKVNLTCPAKGTLGILSAKYYKYSYMWGISTIVGVLELALFLGITLDIAKRLFKMIILEVIAPVPIMSLIDPKGPKDGGAFGNWVKSLTSTFLDIFLKMGLVYIVIVLIHMIVNANDKGGIFANFPEHQGFRGTYLTIFLILGLIFFAKEAPKFIKNALGMKDSGGGGLFDDVKSIGKAAGLVGGAAVGAGAAIAGNVGTSVEAAKDHKYGTAAANLLGSPGAALAGAIRGGSSGMKGAGKNGNVIAGLSGAMSAQSAVNANKRANYENGSTMFGRAAARAGGLIGRTPADVDEAKITGYKAVEDAAKDVDESLTKGIVGSKFTSRHTTDFTGTKGGGFSYAEYRAAIDSNDTTWATAHYNSLAEARADDKAQTDKAKETLYLDYVANKDDAQFSDLRTSETIMSNASKAAKLGAVTDYSSYDTAKKAAKANRRETIANPKYSSRKRNAEAVKKKK